MTRQNIIQQLDDIYKALIRDRSVEREYEFVDQYMIFLGREKTFLPSIVSKLYINHELLFDDLIDLLMHCEIYNMRQTDYSNPFRSKEILEHLNTKERMNKELSKLLTDVKLGYDESLKHPIKLEYDPRLSLTIEKFHMKLIRELRENTTINLTYKNGSITNGSEHIVLTEGTSEKELLDLLEIIISNSKEDIVYFEEIADELHEELDKRFGNKFYQAGKRIDKKCMDVYKQPFFKKISRKFAKLSTVI